MASTIEGKIAEVLFGRLGQLVLSQVMPIAWPNVTFEPPADHRYLRVQFIPNLANRVLIGSDGPHQHMGLMQVSVCWPKGVGEIAARDAAGAVAAHFPCDLRLLVGERFVRITKRPDVRDMIVEDVAIQIPVMIPWECWA